jgi:hypothetical protein
MARFRLLRFAFKASAAEYFLARCGLKRGAPECSSHASPLRGTTGGTTHGVYLLHGEFLGFHRSAVANAVLETVRNSMKGEDEPLTERAAL